MHACVMFQTNLVESVRNVLKKQITLGVRDNMYIYFVR